MFLPIHLIHSSRPSLVPREHLHSLQETDVVMCNDQRRELYLSVFLDSESECEKGSHAQSTHNDSCEESKLKRYALSHIAAPSVCVVGPQVVPVYRVR